jgi:hypothetical protein
MHVTQRLRLTLAAILFTLAAPLTHAAAFSDLFENRILDHLLRGASLVVGSQTATWGTAPEVYIALGTACSDSAFTELAATGSYARVRVPSAGAPSLSNAWSGTLTNSQTVASSGTSGTGYNLNTVTFPTATADWNSAARAVTNGATASFAAGALSVQVDN